MTRRQDVRPAYVRDGTVYAVRASPLSASTGASTGPVCLPLIVEQERSVNLDSESDWQEAERRLGCG